MTTQLTLLPKATAPWLIDDTTRAIGRQGLSQARQALAAAQARATAADESLAVTAHTPTTTHAAAA